MDISYIWKKALDELEKNISAVAFDLWIENLHPLIINDDALILVAGEEITPSSISTIQKNYVPQILQAVNVVNNTIKSIKIIPDSEKQQYINANNDTKTIIPTEIKFNPKYTFDNFVVGKSNEFVNAAARAVSEQPGIYNPLFIYGGVGLGKTHLMHAIGNHISKTKPNLLVTYVTTESFMNELIDAIRGGQDKNLTKRFREKYRNADILMIDDIQFISNKTTTQEEFFHTFNDLQGAGKQIIISSDRPPNELSHLEQRLSSRFSSGLIASITSPDVETRIAILQKKAQQSNISLSPEIFVYLAENFDTNIRELEGLLTKIYFYSTLINQKNINMDIVKAALKDCISTKREAISSDKIISSVCEYYNIDKASIIGKKRSKELVEARHICIYLIYEILSLPLAAIGQIMGNRDHTSIMHARDNVNSRISSDIRISVPLNDIRSIIMENRY